MLFRSSLQVSTVPSIAFELRRVTRTESEHKNLLLSCYVTRLMAPSRIKPSLTTHHLGIFKEALYLALLRSMDYRERQRSQFVRVSGLQMLTQKFGLYLHSKIRPSLMPSPFSCTRREGVWPNMYRARVARATYSARQSDAWIKSHDRAGMNRMHINDCARARSYEI